MRRGLILLLVALLAGCGANTQRALPSACTTKGPEPIAKALAAAPATVRVDGVSLSSCFSRESNNADIQVMGGNLLAVAQRLHDTAASDPGGDAAVQLGYLLGAARRGARSTGVHEELVRRLESEGIRSAAFSRGRRAGLATG
jgi:hypothetical protein